MKKLSLSLAAVLLAAPSVSAAQDIAPPVKRKPAATSAAPAAPRQSDATPAAPQQAARSSNEREIQAALTAAAGQGGDPVLDAGLIRVMTRLAAAGRCSEAAGLAARDGRNELASRARQLCK